MASAKDIKKKIRSFSNTRKITRTMEMVASVKSKRCQDRIRASTPYTEKLAEVIRSLALSGPIAHPLLGRPGSAADAGGGSWVKRIQARLKERLHDAGLREGVRQESASQGGSRREGAAPAKGASAPEGDEAPAPVTLLIIVTGNRGLCGGYNANILHHAERLIQAESEAGRKTEVYMIGKKGVSRFRFKKIPIAEANTALGDQPSYHDAEELSQQILPRFLAGELNRVVVLATRYFSSSVQKPVEIQLLPFSLEDPPLLPGTAPERRDEELPKDPRQVTGAARKRGGTPAGTDLEFIFEPDRSSVLEALIPLAVKNAFYRILVEARASEHVARRVAMKMATDNAEVMIRTYTTRYNRKRQAGITQQITEVVGGAEGLS